MAILAFSCILRADGGAAELKCTCGPLYVATRSVVVLIVLVQWFPKCNVLCGSPAICDRFTEVPWMHVCYGYFEVYLLFNEGSNV
jgi:hypothetical protein